MGVEQNEESRYVDYTKATEWEELLWNLGQAVRKLMVTSSSSASASSTSCGGDGEDKKTACSLEYEGTRMVLTLHGLGSVRESFSAPDFREWFAVDTPFFSLLLPETSHGNASTESGRRRIFSALTTALGSLSANPATSAEAQCPWPSFCKATKSDNVLGYAVLQAPLDADRNILHNYYSGVMTQVSPRDPVNFVDGVIAVFANEVAAATGTVLEVSNRLPVGVTITEWHLSLLDDFNSMLAYNTSSGGVRAIGAGGEGGQGPKMHSLVLGTLDDLWASCPMQLKVTGAPLAPEMFVSLQWDEMQHYQVIENEALTNVHPHSVRREKWTVTAAFRPAPDDSSCDLASGARRLLSLYLLGKTCTTPGESLGAMLETQNTNPAAWDSCVDQALVLTEALSDGGKVALLGMVQPATGGEEATDLEVEAIMRLFASALYVAPAGSYDASAYETTPEQMRAWLGQVPPVGGFVSLLATIVAGMRDPSGMARVWSTCLSQLRLQWESGIPVARLYPPIALQDMDAASPSADREDGLALSDCMLWSDVEARLRVRGLSLVLPDCANSLPHQKLQMLGLCIQCKDEAYCVKPSLPGADQPDYEVPALMRRRPPTSDKVDMKDFVLRQEGTAATLSTANLEASKNDVLVSDMRAFKAINPSAPFDAFRHFHTRGMPERLDAGAVALWKRLWEGCEAQPVSEQKRLFNAESEAEQALSYLERLSPAALASEWLVAFLSTAHFMIRHDATFRRLAKYIGTEAEAFEAGCTSAIVALREDDHDGKGKRGEGLASDNAVSQDLLMTVDAACAHIERMQGFLLHMGQLGKFALIYPRLAVELCLRGSAVPECDAELEALRALAETAGGETRENAWYMRSKRELAHPCRRKLELRHPMGAPWQLQHKLVAIRDSGQNMRISMQFYQNITK